MVALNRGDRVSHAEHGEGVVLKKKILGSYVVAFNAKPALPMTVRRSDLEMIEAEGPKVTPRSSMVSDTTPEPDPSSEKKVMQMLRQMTARNRSQRQNLRCQPLSANRPHFIPRTNWIRRTTSKSSRRCASGLFLGVAWAPTRWVAIGRSHPFRTCFGSERGAGSFGVTTGRARPTFLTWLNRPLGTMDLQRRESFWIHRRSPFTNRSVSISGSLRVFGCPTVMALGSIRFLSHFRVVPLTRLPRAIA